MSPAEPNNSGSGGGATKDQASVKVPSKDPKKKDEKKDEDLVSCRFMYLLEISFGVRGGLVLWANVLCSCL